MNPLDKTNSVMQQGIINSTIKNEMKFNNVKTATHNELIATTHEQEIQHDPRIHVKWNKIFKAGEIKEKTEIKNKQYIYSPKVDGACFFRANLAYQEKDINWLHKKQLKEVYDWIDKKQEVFVNAINMAIDTISQKNYGERIPVEFLVNFSISKNFDLATDLLHSMMEDDEFLLWRGECVQQFLNYYFDVQLPICFCDDFVDNIYQVLAEKLNAPINQNESIHIKREGSIQKGFHYLLISDDDIFNSSVNANYIEKDNEKLDFFFGCSQENPYDGSSEYNQLKYMSGNKKNKRRRNEFKGNEYIEVGYKTKHNDGTSFIRSYLAISNNDTSWVSSKDLIDIYSWISENIYIFQRAIDNAYPHLNKSSYNVISFFNRFNSKIKLAFTSENFLNEMMSKNAFMLFDKLYIQAYAKNNGIDLTLDDTECFVQNLLSALAEQLELIEGYDGNFHCKNGFKINKVDTQEFINEEQEFSNDKQYIYSPKPDGACFFRAHLACQNKNKDWLETKPLIEVYDWIETNKNVFVDSINISIDSISQEDHDETIPVEFLVAFSESKNNDLAENLLYHMMQESEFMRWRGDCIQKFLRYYFSVDLPICFCNNFSDYIYNALAEKLNIPINQNKNIHIKREGSTNIGFHYYLISDSELFNTSVKTPYFIPSGLNIELKGPQEEARIKYIKNIMPHIKIPFVNDTSLSRYTVLKNKKNGSFYRCWLAYINANLYSFAFHTDKKMGCELMENHYFKSSFAKALKETFEDITEFEFTIEKCIKLTAHIIENYFKEGNYNISDVLKKIIQHANSKTIKNTSSVILRLFLKANSDSISDKFSAVFEQKLTEKLNCHVIQEENINDKGVNKIMEFMVNENKGSYSLVCLSNHFEPEGRTELISKQQAIQATVQLFSQLLGFTANFAYSSGYNPHPHVNPEQKEMNKTSNWLKFPGCDAKSVLSTTESLPILEQNDVSFSTNEDDISDEYSEWSKEMAKKELADDENSNKPRKRVKRRFNDNTDPLDIINLNIYNLSPSIDPSTLDDLFEVLSKDENHWKQYGNPKNEKFNAILKEMVRSVKSHYEILDFYTDVVDSIQITTLENNLECRNAYDFYMQKNNDEMISNHEYFYHGLIEKELMVPSSDYFQDMSALKNKANNKLLYLLSNILISKFNSLPINYEALGMAFANLDLYRFMENIRMAKTHTAEIEARWWPSISKGDSKQKYDAVVKELTLSGLDIKLASASYVKQSNVFVKSSEMTREGLCHVMTMSCLIEMRGKNLNSYTEVMKYFKKYKNLLYDDPLTTYRTTHKFAELNYLLQNTPISVDRNGKRLFSDSLYKLFPDLDAMIDSIWKSELGSYFALQDDGGGHAMGLMKMELKNGEKINILFDANVGIIPCYDKETLRLQIQDSLDRLYKNVQDKITFHSMEMTTSNINKLMKITTIDGYSYGIPSLNRLLSQSRQPKLTKNPKWENVFPGLLSNAGDQLTSEIKTGSRKLANHLKSSLADVYVKVLEKTHIFDPSLLSDLPIVLKNNLDAASHDENTKVGQASSVEKKIQTLDDIVIAKDNKDDLYTEDKSRVTYQSSDKSVRSKEKTTIPITVKKTHNINKKELGAALFNGLSELNLEQSNSGESDDIVIKNVNVEINQDGKPSVKIEKEDVSNINHISKDEILKHISDISKNNPYLSPEMINAYVEGEFTYLDLDLMKKSELENHKIKQQMSIFSQSLNKILNTQGHDASQYRIDRSLSSKDTSFINLVKKGTEQIKLKLQLPESVRLEFNEIRKIIKHRVDDYNTAIKMFTDSNPKLVKSIKRYGKGMDSATKVMSIINLHHLIEETQNLESLNDMGKAGLVVSLLDVSIDAVSSSLQMVNYGVKNLVGPVTQLSRVARIGSGMAMGASLVFNFVEIGLYSYSFHHAKTELEREIAHLYLSCSIASASLTIVSIAICSAFPLASPLIATLGFIISAVQENELNRILAKNAAKTAFIEFEKELEALTEIITNIESIAFDQTSHSLIIVSKKLPFTELKIGANGAEIKRNGFIFSTGVFQYLFSINEKRSFDITQIDSYLNPYFTGQIKSKLMKNPPVIDVNLIKHKNVILDNCLVPSAPLVPKTIAVNFDNKNKNVQKNIIFDGHSVRPSYTVTRCTDAKFGGHVHPVSVATNPLVDRLDQCVSSIWQQIGTMYVNKTNVIFSGRATPDRTAYDVVKKTCYMVPTEVELDFLDSEYILSALGQLAPMYHFLRDDLAANYHFNHSTNLFGVSHEYALPFVSLTPERRSTQNNKMLDYKITLLRDGESNLFLHPATTLNISENENSGNARDTSIQLFIDYNVINGDLIGTYDNLKMYYSHSKLENIWILGIPCITPKKGIFPEEAPFIIVRFDDSVHREIYINIINTNMDGDNYVCVLKLMQDSTFSLSHFTSFPFTSIEDAEEELSTFLDDLSDKSPAIIFDGFNIYSLSLKSKYHSLSLTKEQIDPNQIFESSAIYLKTNPEDVIKEENPWKLVTKIWRKTAPEELKEIFRRMHFIEKIPFDYKNIPQELQGLFTEKKVVFVSYFYDETTKTMIKQYGDTEIRYWASEDIRKCSRIPQKIFWQDEVTQTYSCGSIHLSPNVYENAITSNRVHLMVDSLNIVPEFNSEPNRKSKNIFDYILWKSDVYFKGIINNELKKTFTPDISNSYFMDIQHLGKNNSTEEQFILVNDDALGLAILPKKENIIAIPKNSNYALSLRQRTDTEVKELIKIYDSKNKPEMSSYYFYLNFLTPHNKESETLTKSQKLFQILKRPLIVGDDLNSMSDKFITSSNLSQSLSKNAENILDNILITKVSNQPNEKRFICHDVHGVVFSLSHDLSQRKLHGVKSNYLLDNNISIHDKAAVTKAFNNLEYIYGQSEYPYFKIQESTFDETGLSSTPSVLINSKTKEVIYLPAHFRGPDGVYEIPEESVIVSEGNYGGSGKNILVVQDSINKYIYEVHNSDSIETQAVSVLPYGYLEKSDVDDLIYISVPTSSDRFNPEDTYSLPFLGTRNIVLMPSLIDKNELAEIIEILPLMQNHLTSLTLVRSTSQISCTQRISVHTGDQNEKRVPKLIIQKFGENNHRIFLILPTAKIINDLHVENTPLIVELDSLPWFLVENYREIIMFNGQYIDFPLLFQSLTFLDMEEMNN